MLPRIFELVSPRTMVDVGCGLGDWLAAATELGVEEIRGLDGPWVPEDRLLIGRESFTQADFREPLPALGRYDLAICLEVAEHLPAEIAESFIRGLCGLAPAIAFSAAIPGQGGLHHINEQWPSYWVDIFRDAGFEAMDVLRPRIWEERRIPYWYRQNTILFVSREAGELRSRLQDIAQDGDFHGADLVHPEHALRALQYPGVTDLVRALPYAVARSFAAAGSESPEAKDSTGSNGRNESHKDTPTG